MSASLERNPFGAALALPGDVLTPTEVAEVLRLRESTVRAMARDGRLPCLRMGRALRFEREQVAAFIETCRRG